jgi:hypothetical protein
MAVVKKAVREQVVEGIYRDQQRRLEIILENLVFTFDKMEDIRNPRNLFKNGTPIKLSLEIINREISKPYVKEAIARMIVATKIIKNELSD